MTTNDAARLGLARSRRDKSTLQPLFRAKALRAAQEPLHGTVTIVMPPSAWASAALSLLALLLLGVAAFIVEIPQSVRAAGVLMPPDGFIRIVSAGPGQITAVKVREGEPVSAGQPLLEISAERGSIDRGPIAASQLRSLKEESRLTEVARREHERMQADRVRAVDDQLEGLRRRMELAETEIALQLSRGALLSTRSGRLEKLADSGSVPAVHYEDAKLAALQADATQALLQQQAVQLDAQYDELLHGRGALVEEAGLRKIEFAIAREQINRQIAELEAQVRRELQAPADGIVARVAVRPGQAVGAGQTLATLNHGEAQLQAWLYVNSADAGLLQTGQQVELRLEAWPHQLFGTLPATVASISSIALLPADLDVPFAVPGPVFEVRASLSRQHMTARGTNWPLAAGTSFQADVVQRRYRLYEWLLRWRRQDEPTPGPIDA